MRKIFVIVAACAITACAQAQIANQQKRVDLSYTATFAKNTMLQWSSTHDMNRLDRMFDYHFRFQSGLNTNIGRFSLFASEDGYSLWSREYTSRNYGVSWQNQGPNFGISLTLMHQMHPWSGPDNGLRLKIDLRSDFK